MIKDCIHVGVDATDHVAFFCPNCKGPLKVYRVETRRVLVDCTDSMDLKYDKCTWIHLKCDKHGPVGWRKFYWTTEDGQYCTRRTDSEVENLRPNSA